MPIIEEELWSIRVGDLCQLSVYSLSGLNWPFFMLPENTRVGSY